MNKKRMLLTHAAGPYPTYGNNESTFDLMASRFTKGQDIFTISMHCHMPPLHLLAQNINMPVTVLEFPTLNDFKKELKNNYDYVGFTHNIVNTDRILEMCRLVRRISPRTKIILGGYGVMCLKEVFENIERQKELIDYVCWGEGISFLRDLFGQKKDDPIMQLLPSQVILTGLGCPNLCEFCNTSHFFRGRYIEVYKADQIFNTMKENFEYRRRPTFLFDENFLINRDRVLELGKLIREDEEFGLRHLSIRTFASIEELSQYTIEELVLSGFDNLWIGVESLFSYFKKRKSADEVKRWFYLLHNAGIETTGSWIIGLDQQAPENVQEDIEFFVNLSPTFTQVSSLAAGPGTKLWERLRREGRLLKDLPWEKHNQYDYINAKNFTKEEVKNIIETTYRRIYLKSGPSYMRSLQIHINGYNYCVKSDNKYLKEHKSYWHKNLCKKLYPYIKAAYIYAPNDSVKSQIKQIEKEYIEIFGKPNRKQLVFSNYLVCRFTKKKIKWLILGKQPRKEPFRKFFYPNDGTRFNDRPYMLTYPRFSLQYFLKKISPDSIIFQILNKRSEALNHKR